MHTAYDPWGRRRAPRSVPLDTALALRDEAQRAQQRAERAEARVIELERVRRHLEQAQDASSALREERDQLRDALARAERPRPMPEAAPPAPPAPGRADLEQALAALEQQNTDLRRDLANVRRHRDEAVARAAETARQAALEPVIGTLDDLDRALGGLPEGAVREGLEALRQRTARRLAEAGVVAFAPSHDPFDPQRHEAIGIAPGPSGEVVSIERCGLSTVDGAVLRPARVVVGSGRSS